MSDVLKGRGSPKGCQGTDADNVLGNRLLLDATGARIMVDLPECRWLDRRGCAANPYGGMVRGGGRPTLEEVAARAGVGRGTVSRVINGSPRVSDAHPCRRRGGRRRTRLRTQPRRPARWPPTAPTPIALVVPEPETRLLRGAVLLRHPRAASARRSPTRRCSCC